MPTKLVILALAATLILAVLGVIVLAARQQPIPDVLQNIAVGALAGLVGVLAPTRG